MLRKWLLKPVLDRLEHIMATLADIGAAVAAEQTVEQGVIVLLQNLSADLKAAIASNDPVAMQAIVTTIDANSAALAAAVTANTPAAPTPPAPAPTPPAATP
jgi:hypothetical protein